MPTKLPICPSCPQCGSRRFQSIRPDGVLAYRNDRQCLACETRYSLPTPAWAAIVFILIGIVLAVGCTASLIIVMARGSIAGLPLNLAFAMLGIVSVRLGFLSLRQEVATAPEPLASEPVTTTQDYKQWVWKNRGKLICATIATVVLLALVESTRRSLAAIAVREAQEKAQLRAALRTLTQLGGSVDGWGWGNERPTGITLERSTANRMFNGLHVGTRDIVDADVALITSFPDLESLFIRAPEVTNAGLRQLPPQPKLTSFIVNCPRVTEDGLGAIAGMRNLAHLNLSGTPVRTLSAFELGHLTQLTSLDLSATAISNDSASELASLQAIKQLDLSATHVDDDCLKSLAKLSNLEELRLSDIPVTDRGLVHLQALSKLVFLDVTNTRVTESGRDALIQHLPNCTVILR